MYVSFTTYKQPCKTLHAFIVQGFPIYKGGALQRQIQTSLYVGIPNKNKTPPSGAPLPLRLASGE